MDNYELVLHDIKDILSTIGEVNYVSHGKPKPLNEEDTFTSVYILPTADNFKLESAGNGISSYDNFVYIRLIINMDCTNDDLSWVRTRRVIIDTILEDSPIWSRIVDRDIVSAVHDDYVNHPRKAMEILFEFRIREECS